MKKMFLICLVLSNVHFLFALDIPKTSKYDKRIAFAKYNADEVFLVKCKAGYVSLLKFSPMEKIVNIATGFSDGWELVAKENFLFIKPKSYSVDTKEQAQTDENGEPLTLVGSPIIQPNTKDWQTNLIVTTTRRIYVFELRLQKRNINYKIDFSYPQEELRMKQKKLLEKEKKELQKDLEKTTVPRNWDYLVHINKNSEDIQPNYIYDDGVFTYIGFDNTKIIPSVFLYDISQDNKESMLNTHIKKDGNYDVLVVHKVTKEILLRYGKKLVGVFNRGYRKNPLDKTNSTINKSIKREIVNEQ